MIEPPFLIQNSKQQALTVTNRCLYSIGASLYHSIAAITNLFTLNIARFHDHNAVAEYHFVRFASACSFYFRARGRIINFGVNRVEPPCKELTGKRFHSWCKNSASEKIPLLESELKKEVKEACFGISLDYIARYLRQIRSGRSPREAVIQVSQLFREKATKEAHMVQSLHRAQDIDTLKISWKNEYEDACSNALAKFLSSPLGTQIDTPKPQSAEELLILKDNQIAKNLGIELSFASALVDRVTKRELNAHVKALKPGVYFVNCFEQMLGLAHAAVLIKVNDRESYLHEPSQGSEILTDDPASSLQGIWSEHYFFSCKSHP